MNRKFEINTLVRIAFLLAFSILGAQIKIPSLIGTPALDSFPAYLAALSWGGTPGAIVGFLGHFFTSLIVGFPLSLPLHLIIGIGMVGCVIAVSKTVMHYGKLPACIIGVIANGIILPSIFVVIPGFGVSFFLSMIPALIVSSSINIILAYSMSPVADRILGADVNITKGVESD
ncbi:alpha-ribazole transporter [Natranaerobius trueperi]|uniref:Alpha-ribazole transporter n=1 Tax=Natranaerobius trueperi TaxID=759412 RepID=A0A226BXW4_9FIRM|nr:alpha-ribazole transporter [Natranaerobius trueperi]OWZ82970.1 alpha-ribazole transporter [Natranaerobius trueperi]